MTLEHFLPLVADASGIILCHTKPGVTLGEKVNPNRAKHFTNIQDFLAFAATQSAAGCDVYFTPAKFKTSKRTKAHAISMKAVWVDLDVRGEAGKGFATSSEAASSLLSFVADFKLPSPTIVSSGSGLHAYWVCDTVMTPAEWEPRAAALHVKIKQFGGDLAADTARITDSASMMRLPGFMNHKRGAMATVVYTAKPIPKEQFDAFFTIGSSSPAPTTRTPASAPTSALSPPGAPMLGQRPAYLGGGASGLVVPPVAPPHHTSQAPNKLDTVVRPTYAQLLTQCGLLRHLAQHPDTVSEPLWKMSLNVVLGTTEGVVAAHEFSAGYAGYSAAETQEKIDNAGEFGKAVLCSTLAAQSDQGFRCDGCPLKGRNTSPLKGAHAVNLVQQAAGTTTALEHALKTVEAYKAVSQQVPNAAGVDGVALWGIIPLHPGTQTQDPTIKLTPPPQGYVFGNVTTGFSGVFAIANMSKPITPDLLWIDRKTETISDRGAAAVGFRVNFIGTDGLLRRYYMRGKDFESRAMETWLRETGIATEVTPELRNYLWAACERVRRTREPPLYIASAYGWYLLGGKRVFCSPTGVITEDGIQRDILVSDGGHHVMEADVAHGATVGAWNDSYRTMYEAGDHHIHYFMMSSLASVLFSPYGEGSTSAAGMIMVMSGLSSAGKSWASTVCQTIWQKPEFVAGNSTWNALPKEASDRRHLPLFVDDMPIDPNNEARIAARNAILHYTLGREKSRLSAKNSLDAVGRWANIMMISTNADITSVIEGFDVGGGATARIIEVRMSASNRNRATEDQRNARNKVLKNYGVMGMEFIRRLMGMPVDEITATIGKYDTMITDVLSAQGMSAEARNNARIRIQLTAFNYFVSQVMGDLLPYAMKDTLDWAVQSLFNGEFSTGTNAPVGASQRQKVLRTMHKLIVSGDAAIHRWVTAHPDGRRVRSSDLEKVAEELKLRGVDGVTVVPPIEYAQMHNAQLMQRSPSVGIIQAFSWDGTPHGFYIALDLLDGKKRHNNPVSRRLVEEALGEPSVPEGITGDKRIQHIDIGKVTNGALRGIKNAFVYLTPEEINDIGDTF